MFNYTLKKALNKFKSELIWGFLGGFVLTVEVGDTIHPIINGLNAEHREILALRIINIGSCDAIGALQRRYL